MKPPTLNRIRAAMAGRSARRTARSIHYNGLSHRFGHRFGHRIGAGAMSRLLSIVATVILLGALPAQARDWGYYPMQGQGQQKGQGEYQRGGGGKDYRRDKAPRPPRDDRHQGRMTDEERRDLHRDLDRANREIYRRNPR